jgi:hypothetical protein
MKRRVLDLTFDPHTFDILVDGVPTSTLNVYEGWTYRFFVARPAKTHVTHAAFTVIDPQDGITINPPEQSEGTFDVTVGFGVEPRQFIINNPEGEYKSLVCRIRKPIDNYVADTVENILPEAFSLTGAYPGLAIALKVYFEQQGYPGEAQEFLRHLDRHSDIDTCGYARLLALMGDLLPTFPIHTLVDLRLLIKHAQDFINDRGSVRSIQFLIRALFGVPSTVRTPGDFALTCSDGASLGSARLQDDFYIQDYSYEITSTQPLSTYEKALVDNCHQAGTQYFGEYIAPPAEKLLTTFALVPNNMLAHDASTNFSDPLNSQYIGIIV